MSRKARRQAEKEQRAIKGRNKRYMDAIDELNGNKKETDDTKGKPVGSDTKQQQQSPPAANGQGGTGEVGYNPADEVVAQMNERPDISTMYMDEEFGTEYIIPGRNVMDPITRKAVKLSDLGPEYRLAQQFPGCPNEDRQKHRYNWGTCEVPDMIDAMEKAMTTTLEDGSVGIPPIPSVTNEGIDFVLANRDLLGHRMAKTLGRLMMRSAWQKKPTDMRRYRRILQNFFLIENYISAPFRQMIMDAEIRIGPNFGNLEVKAFGGGELYERVANYLVLKGMQCTWEKKVRDAEFIENTDLDENDVVVMLTGDPRRYEPKPEIIYELNECVQVCAMSQKMVKAFVETPEFFDDLPVEVRFLEAALSVKGGTALRKFILEDFCPKEGITPAGLREGVRRLMQQLDNMYLDPYGDIRNTVDKLAKAMAVGTDDERNPYAPYIASVSKNSPGYFETHTFNYHPMSLVRFLDSKKFNPTAQSFLTSSSDTPDGPLTGVSTALYLPMCVVQYRILSYRIVLCWQSHCRVTHNVWTRVHRYLPSFLDSSVFLTLCIDHTLSRLSPFPPFVSHKS